MPIRIHRSSIRNRLKIPNFELLRDVKIRPIPTWFSAASESSCPLGGRLAGKGPHSAAPGARGTRGAGKARGMGPGPGLGWGAWNGARGPARLAEPYGCFGHCPRPEGPGGRGSRCELEAARAAIRFGGLVTEGVLKCTSNPQDLARKRTRAPPHFQCTPRSCTLAARTLTIVD